MKAARIHDYGDADVIRYEDVPPPVPGPGEILIKVAAAAHNPSDVGLRSGALRTVLPTTLPVTLGVDVSGTVVRTAPGVVRPRVGDRVIGWLDRGGAMAEFATAAADRVVAAPSAIPLAHAAAIPLAGLTAWQALFDHAGVTEGRTVLVNGAGGGVGGFAVQFARHAGARVIATASPRSAGAVRGQGADRVIDYASTPVADALRAGVGPVDAMINLVPTGRAVTTALRSLVRPGGVFVSVTVPVGTGDAGAVRMLTRNDVAQLTEIVRLVDAGTVRVDVAGTAALSDLAAVHEKSQAGGTRGKIIIVP